MIKILVGKGVNRVFEYGKIEKGIFQEADPNTELYKVTNDKGVFYAVAEGFTEYEVEEVPENYQDCTYTPEDGFVEIEKEPTEEERITALEEENQTLVMTLDDILTNVIPAMMGMESEVN